MTSLLGVWMLLVPAQVETPASPDFPKELQLAALTATVRIGNPARHADGSGVVIGKSGPFIYILTAQHVVAGADEVEVATFTAASYPKPHAVYRSARVVCSTPGLADLALVRLTTTDPPPGSLRLCPAQSVPAAAGFSALTVGCEDGKAPTCLVEQVSGKKMVRRQAGGPGALFWEVERKQSPGRSGGPLVDKRGLLLGVCSGTNREKSYYGHVEEVQTFLRQNGFRWLAEEAP